MPRHGFTHQVSLDGAGGQVSVTRIPLLFQTAATVASMGYVIDCKREVGQPPLMCSNAAVAAGMDMYMFAVHDWASITGFVTSPVCDACNCYCCSANLLVCVCYVHAVAG